MKKARSFTKYWIRTYSLTSFPTINAANIETFHFAWAHCSSLISFPKLNFKEGKCFYSAWAECRSLTYFPPNIFDNLFGEMGRACFFNAWKNCDLNSESIENILTSINRAKITPCQEKNSEIIGLNTHSNIRLTENTLQSIKSLKAKNWTISINNEPV